MHQAAAGWHAGAGFTTHPSRRSRAFNVSGAVLLMPAVAWAPAFWQPAFSASRLAAHLAPHPRRPARQQSGSTFVFEIGFSQHAQCGTAMAAHRFAICATPPFSSSTDPH